MPKIIKIYGADPNAGAQHRYSPPACTGTEIAVVTGNPNPGHVSTSNVERHNLTMRISMRRFTRLTNAFSKKLENHMWALALFFMHYDFCRAHKTLSKPYPRTPAMAAGLTDHVWTVEEMLSLLADPN